MRLIQGSRHIFFITLAWGCMAFIPCYGQTLRDEYIECANERLQLKDYKEALAYYNRIIAMNPQDSVIYFDRARVKEFLDDRAGAIADYSKAINIDPTNPDNYYYRGMAKHAIKDDTGAIADYDKSLQIEPENADIHYYRGLSKVELKDFKSAIEDFTVAISLHSDLSPAAYAGRGLASELLHDLKSAISDYDHAIGLSPKEAAYYLKRAELKMAAGQKDSACPDLYTYKSLGGSSTTALEKICR